MFRIKPFLCLIWTQNLRVSTFQNKIFQQSQRLNAKIVEKFSRLTQKFQSEAAVLMVKVQCLQGTNSKAKGSSR